MGQLIGSIERFVANEAWKGERTVARIRLLICSFAALRMLLIDFEKVRAGEPSLAVPLAAILVGVAVSGKRLIEWDPTPPVDLPSRLRLSVLFDLFLLFAVLVPRVLWPNHVYDGIIHTTEFIAVPLVMIGAGLRLSVPAAWVGSLSGTGLAIGLVLFEQTWSSAPLNYSLGQATLTFVFLGGTVILSTSIASRTLRLVHQGWGSAERAEKIRRRLGAYVSPEFAGEVMREAPGGEYRGAAMLFSDLRGFTTYAEDLPPDRLFTELNAYLEAMVPAISEHGGVIDKFIGDAIMAVFGVPKPTGDEGARAIRAAKAMERALVEHNRARQSQGLPPLAHGIGVHVGPLTAGNLGTTDRVNFTVLGDTVNVASRLEGLCKNMKQTVIVSADVVETLSGATNLPDLVEIGSTPIRGREHEMVVYTLADEPAS